MSVQFVSITPNAEETILYIARVSSNQENTDTGLIRYLIRNKHWSPFEHGFMTLEFNTSRGIAQQILRHRSFSFQEFSQRYAEPDDFEIYEGRRQAEKNRQSSIDDLSDPTKAWWDYTQREVAEFAFKRYRLAVASGVARECARFILPISTKTKLYMSGSIRSWIHYFEQRCDEHTQLEHRVLALEARAIFIEQLPVISEALDWTS